MTRWLVDIALAGTLAVISLVFAIEAKRGQWHGSQPLNWNLLVTLFTDSIATAFEAVKGVIYCPQFVFASFDQSRIHLNLFQRTRHVQPVCGQSYRAASSSSRSFRTRAKVASSSRSRTSTRFFVRSSFTTRLGALVSRPVLDSIIISQSLLKLSSTNTKAIHRPRSTPAKSSRWCPFAYPMARSDTQ